MARAKILAIVFLVLSVLLITINPILAQEEGYVDDTISSIPGYFEDVPLYIANAYEIEEQWWWQGLLVHSFLAVLFFMLIYSFTSRVFKQMDNKFMYIAAGIGAFAFSAIALVESGAMKYFIGTSWMVMGIAFGLAIPAVIIWLFTKFHTHTADMGKEWKKNKWPSSKGKGKKGKGFWETRRRKKAGARQGGGRVSRKQRVVKKKAKEGEEKKEKVEKVVEKELGAEKPKEKAEEQEEKAKEKLSRAGKRIERKKKRKEKKEKKEIKKEEKWTKKQQRELKEIDKESKKIRLERGKALQFIASLGKILDWLCASFKLPQAAQYIKNVDSQAKKYIDYLSKEEKSVIKLLEKRKSATDILFKLEKRNIHENLEVTRKSKKGEKDENIIGRIISKEILVWQGIKKIDDSVGQSDKTILAQLNRFKDLDQKDINNINPPDGFEKLEKKEQEEFIKLKQNFLRSRDLEKKFQKFSIQLLKHIQTMEKYSLTLKENQDRVENVEKYIRNAILELEVLIKKKEYCKASTQVIPKLRSLFNWEKEAEKQIDEIDKYLEKMNQTNFKYLIENEKIIDALFHIDKRLYILFSLEKKISTKERRKVRERTKKKSKERTKLRRRKKKHKKIEKDVEKETSAVLKLKHIYLLEGRR